MFLPGLSDGIILAQFRCSQENTFDGLAQDYGNSSALALELLQFAMPSFLLQ